MPRGTEHQPRYTREELRELEDRTRGWMHMDREDKLKLIEGNQLVLEQRQIIRELWHEADRVWRAGADISEDLLKRVKLYL